MNQSIEVTVSEHPDVIIEMPCPSCGKWLEVGGDCEYPIPPGAWCDNCSDVDTSGDVSRHTEPFVLNGWVLFPNAEYEHAWEGTYSYPGVLRIRGAFRVRHLQEQRRDERGRFVKS